MPTRIPVTPTGTGNSFWNIAPATAVLGPADISGDTSLTGRPALSTAHPWIANPMPAALGSSGLLSSVLASADIVQHVQSDGG